MTNPSSPVTHATSAERPVLFWRPDSDETQVQANVEQAAKFLDVPAEEVIAAIEKGDLLAGWFVDWEAAGGA
jgi:hypothetical protein